MLGEEMQQREIAVVRDLRSAVIDAFGHASRRQRDHGITGGEGYYVEHAVVVWLAEAGDESDEM